MDNYFLVTGELHTRHYMQDKAEVEQVTRLVVAADEEEAYIKFDDHFRSQSRDYDVSYYVYHIEVHETIR